jgi:hypothetical protein
MSDFDEQLNNISSEKQLYVLRTLPNHLAEAGQEARLHRLLTDFAFIEVKIQTLEPQPLIQDYDLVFLNSSGFTEDEERAEKSLRLIQGAIRLATHILVQDKTQLKSQLYCRLMPFDASLNIQSLLEQISRRKAQPWLRSLTPSLTPPGGPLLRTLPETWPLYAVAVTSDGQIMVSASEDTGLKVWDLPHGEVLYKDDFLVPLAH